MRPEINMIHPTKLASNEPAAEHIDMLKASATSTFGAICGSTPVCEDAPEGSEEHDGMTGIIAVVGDLSWSLTVGFPPETAVAVAKKFAGFDIPYDSPDMRDVVGELANVLAGDVIARLERLGVGAKMSLPTVAQGHDVSLWQTHVRQSHKMRVTLPQGSMWLGLAVASK